MVLFAGMREWWCFSSAGNTGEGCALLQIFDESIDVAQVFAEKVLLVLLRPGVLLRCAAPVVAIRAASPPVECSGKFARTPLQTRGRCLWHEVEVQELEELDFDVLCCLFVLK